MARPLQLKPRKDRSGRWRVNVPPTLALSDKRERRFFPTLTEAKAFIETLKCRRDNLTSLPTLSPAMLLDAAGALELLNDQYPGVTLVSAVRGYLEVELQRGRSCSLAELFDRFRVSREKKSATYLRDLKWAHDKLYSLMAMTASDVAPVHIAMALSGIAPTSKNNILRSLKAVFRYGADLGLVGTVPIRKNDFATIPRKEVEVLPVEKIRQLLEAALEHDAQLLPLLLAEVFAGIRPAEARRIQWNDVDLTRGKITVRAAISKTNSGRSIRLADNALAWFGCCPKGSGPIAPWPESLLLSRLRKVRTHAGYGHGAGTRWRPGSLRDCFCSYHCAHFNDVSRLTLKAGHSSLITTRNHYLGVTTSEAAAEFWDLYPPGHQANVVQFTTG